MSKRTPSNYVAARTRDDRTILIDVAKHFPAAREYELQNLMSSLQHTSNIVPSSVGVFTI